MLRYTNETTIEPIKYTKDDNLQEFMKNYRTPARQLEKGNLLSCILITDDLAFAELYEDWLLPCVLYMYMKDKETNPEKLCELFKTKWEDEKLQEEEGKVFLQNFIYFIQGKNPYGIKIWPRCCGEWIIGEVEENLKTQAPYYMRLRVAAVCILLAAPPQKVFKEGENWFGEFLSDTEEDGFLNVEEGMTFTLNFSAVDSLAKLYPKILRNADTVPCCIRIIYGQNMYYICLPPYGRIKAVFEDEKCNFLAGIKGNISFNDGITAKNAFVQLADSEESTLFMLHANHKKRLFQMGTGSSCKDGGADGVGGHWELSSNILFRNGKAVRKEKYPIRVYGAGKLWALQYEDGCLESDNLLVNAMKMNGIGKVLTIVEKEDQSLLLRDVNGAWEWNGNALKKITDAALVSCMLDRFQEDGLFEHSKSSFMDISIGYDGKVK